MSRINRSVADILEEFYDDFQRSQSEEEQTGAARIDRYFTGPSAEQHVHSDTVSVETGLDTFTFGTTQKWGEHSW